MAGKKTKKKQVTENKKQPQMKLVTSEVCAVCKQQCERGLRYLERMSEPGAKGYGVPCILTLRNDPTSRTRS